MLLPSWLWLCAFGAAAPTPQPAEPEPQEETAGETVVAVLPLVVVGELLPRWHTEARARLVSGLSRGSLNVRAADVDADCRDPTCWSEQRTMAGADFVAAATLRVGDARDYALTIEVLSARTGKVVGSNGGTCELCGFEEAVSMIESRAAVLAPEVARLGAVLPVLMFRSDPVGVVVSLDGEVRGPTPIRIQAPAGPHTVEASMAGFLSQTFEIEAVDGVRKEVELRLVPRPD
ncbi:MAG: PEGA domain-containing protein, partial [Myxococcota bacterium]